MSQKKSSRKEKPQSGNILFYHKGRHFILCDCNDDVMMKKYWSKFFS